MANLSYDAIIDHIYAVDDTYDANTSNGYTLSPTTYYINSESDADAFCKRFKRTTGYVDHATNTTLHIGDKIYIGGFFKATWYVAGFDVEHNQIAADGTVYDNGYGIALVPVTYIEDTFGGWLSTLNGTFENAYIGSNIYFLVNNATSNYCSSHTVERNVLLSSAVNSYNKSCAYEWDTRYGTCMSGCQLTGTAAIYSNKYDDGEANYKLPLFDNIGYGTGSAFFLRGIWGFENSKYYVWTVDPNGSIIKDNANIAYYVRPYIYIR